MNTEAEIVASYLAEIKLFSGKYKWSDKGHIDYIEVTIPLICSAMPEINGELRMTAHRTRTPQKFSFTLLAGSVRIAALDVNPGSTHFNTRTLTSVSGTHWHWYPDLDAELDERPLSHGEWLSEFCDQARISLDAPYEPPPHDPVQLELL